MKLGMYCKENDDCEIISCIDLPQATSDVYGTMTCCIFKQADNKFNFIRVIHEKTPPQIENSKIGILTIQRGIPPCEHKKLIGKTVKDLKTIKIDAESYISSANKQDRIVGLRVLSCNLFWSFYFDKKGCLHAIG